jgi:hypothetical protein
MKPGSISARVSGVEWSREVFPDGFREPAGAAEVFPRGFLPPGWRYTDGSSKRERRMESARVAELSGRAK